MQKILSTSFVLLFQNGNREFHFKQAKLVQNVVSDKKFLRHIIKMTGAIVFPQSIQDL